MKKTQLRQYARLIVNVGARVQPGQPVLLQATLDQPEFTRLVAEECYQAGASRVEVRWDHQPITKLHVQYQSEEELCRVEPWRLLQADNDTDPLPCRIRLRSVDPNGMKGTDPKKADLRSRAVSSALKPYTQRRVGNEQWCIAAVPNRNWARKLFPGQRAYAAENALWRLILKATRCDGEDPQKAWQEHNLQLRRRKEYLNAQRLYSVHFYASNGTDLTMKLIPQAEFLGGEKVSAQGQPYNANLPTEECFTTPKRDSAEGIVYGSKPWCWNGVIIEDYYLRFHKGRVVEYGAKKNRQALKRLLEMDEGAAYLGEFALVPWESPINQTGVLFYDTLFDENACCHLALGRGFPNTVPDHSRYSHQQLQVMGINDSIIHQDFMIGTEDMNIDGITEDCRVIPLFRNGTWAF